MYEGYAKDFFEQKKLSKNFSKKITKIIINSKKPIFQVTKDERCD